MLGCVSRPVAVEWLAEAWFSDATSLWHTKLEALFRRLVSWDMLYIHRVNTAAKAGDLDVSSLCFCRLARGLCISISAIYVVNMWHTHGMRSWHYWHVPWCLNAIDIARFLLHYCKQCLFCQPEQQRHHVFCQNTSAADLAPSHSTYLW